MIKINQKLIIRLSLIAVALNVILPMLLKSLATAEEIKPPNGADKLSLKSQLMHMFVHHAQVPMSSSIIIAVIVAVSILISENFNF
jgi:hypothetical protein